MINTPENKKILLIGGAGFIGHNLALHLAKLGGTVEIIDGLQVNNLLTYSSSYPDLHNKELYLKIINQRLDLLRDAGIPLHPVDATWDRCKQRPGQSPRSTLILYC